jgi:cytochrome c peroxidase
VRWRLAVALAAAVVLTGAAEHSHDPAVVKAPGWGPLEFVAPVPSSYVLPSLWAAQGGRVLDESGTALDLAELLGDKLVLLSFIYTSCSDVNGCPLATHVLQRVQHALRENSALTDRVRLISLSFDRAHDTPAAMAEYASHFRTPGADWPFLTTSADADLQVLLDRYDQWIVKDYDASGNYRGTISHLLRVYLIDTNRRVRNIYSVSFLHTDTVINDLLSIVASDTQRD